MNTPKRFLVYVRQEDREFFDRLGHGMAPELFSRCLQIVGACAEPFHAAIVLEQVLARIKSGESFFPSGHVPAEPKLDPRTVRRRQQKQIFKPEW